MKLKLFIIIIIGSFSIKAQTPETISCLDEIKKYNLNILWRADSIQAEGDGEKGRFPEPLGYIGQDYQRFYIHYTSVIKSKENPCQYNVVGKTKVKNNICSFKGTITITKAFIYKEPIIPEFKIYKTGTVICQVDFNEDSTRNSSGKIYGELTTDFYIDKKGKICYDALMIVGDSYSNNQCIATWTNYKTNTKKVCNWGDYRMPRSKELDTGTGGVYIEKKYVQNGWQSYVDTYNIDDKISEQALQIENTLWWK